MVRSSRFRRCVVGLVVPDVSKKRSILISEDHANVGCFLELFDP